MFALTCQVRFVVMNNVFRTDLDLHRKFDLKGSTYGRTAGPKPGATGEAGVVWMSQGTANCLRGHPSWGEQLCWRLCRQEACRQKERQSGCCGIAATRPKLSVETSVSVPCPTCHVPCFLAHYSVLTLPCSHPQGPGLGCGVSLRLQGPRTVSTLCRVFARLRWVCPLPLAGCQARPAAGRACPSNHAGLLGTGSSLREDIHPAFEHFSSCCPSSALLLPPQPAGPAGGRLFLPGGHPCHGLLPAHGRALQVVWGDLRLAAQHRQGTGAGWRCGGHHGCTMQVLPETRTSVQHTWSHHTCPKPMPDPLPCTGGERGLPVSGGGPQGQHRGGGCRSR